LGWFTALRIHSAPTQQYSKNAGIIHSEIEAMLRADANMLDDLTTTITINNGLLIGQGDFPRALDRLLNLEYLLPAISHHQPLPIRQNHGICQT
jgi:hypothetical protein